MFQHTEMITESSRKDVLNQHRFRPWPLFGVLIGVMLVSWLVSQHWVVPDSNSQDPEGKAFSAQSAMRHLKHFAGQPRPVGSRDLQETRSYLKQTLRKMGLQPQRQKTSTILRFPDAPGYAAGTVENIIVRIPGTESTGAIALNAHYDGAATGPAVADCGSCVITILETLRVVLEGPPLKNDLIAVFSDAEEVGDLGAHAFATQHPWMKEIRLVINYEAMGTEGPAYLYATSHNNSDLISAYVHHAPWNMSNSFIVGVFGLIPEQRLACDLQDYLNEGVSGYGFVFTGNTSAYHTMLDNKESLDPGTVQQLGDNTLALLRHYDKRNLDKIGGNSRSVFFSLWPGLAIHYPASASFPLALFGICLLLLILGLGIRLNRFNLPQTIISVVHFFVAVFFSTVVAGGTWMMFKILNPNLKTALIGNWAVDVYLVGLLILAATIMLGLSILLRRKIDIHHQMAGALSGFALLSFFFSLIFPVGSYVFTWPLLIGVFVMLGFLLDDRQRDRPWMKAVMLVSVLATAMFLLIPIMMGPNPFVGLLIRLDALTGLPLLAINSALAALLTGYSVPFIVLLSGSKCANTGIRRWAVPIAGLLLSAIVFVSATAQSGYDHKHPRPESIRYELDADTGQAHWVTGDSNPGQWISKFLPPEKMAASSDATSLLEYWPTTFSGSAPRLNLPHPDLQVLEEYLVKEQRIMRLNVSSGGAAYMLFVDIHSNAPISQASLNGKEIQLEGYQPAERGRLKLNYAACPPEGFEVMLTLNGTDPVSVSLVEISDGLPLNPEEEVYNRSQMTMPSPLSADYTVVRINKIL